MDLRLRSGPDYGKSAFFRGSTRAPLLDDSQGKAACDDVVGRAWIAHHHDMVGSAYVGFVEAIRTEAKIASGSEG